MNIHIRRANGPMGVLDLQRILFVLVYLPPLPPQRAFWTESSFPKVCHNSLGRPWAAPWALKGPPGIPLGSSEGTLRPQWPPQNMPTSPFDLPTSVFSLLSSHVAPFH